MLPHRPPHLPPRSNRQQAILQAAEQLFAQRGFNAVTIRQIASLAQVPLALVGYYFSHKEGLFRAVFAHRSAWQHEAQRALDEARRGAGDSDGLRRVIEAFVQPLMRLRQNPGSRHYAQLLSRQLAHADAEAEPALQEHLDPLLQRFLDALQAALPKASRSELTDAWRFALGAVLLQLGEHRLERLLPGPRGETVGAARLSELIAGGIRAALAPPLATAPSLNSPADTHPRVRR